MQPFLFHHATLWAPSCSSLLQILTTAAVSSWVWQTHHAWLLSRVSSTTSLLMRGNLQSLWKTVLQKFKTELLYIPAIPLLVYVQKKRNQDIKEISVLYGYCSSQYPWEPWRGINLNVHQRVNWQRKGRLHVYISKHSPALNDDESIVIGDVDDPQALYEMKQDMQRMASVHGSLKYRILVTGSMCCFCRAECSSWLS